MMVKPLLIAAFALACAGSAAACEVPADAPLVRLSGVDAHNDPRLEDGRILRLSGLAPRHEQARAAFAAAIERRRGHDFRLVIRGEPDRWQRWPARLFDVAEGEAGDLSRALLAEGAAARWPESGAPCDKPLLDASAAAVDGHDVAALRAHAGRLVTVSGRIASVGERSRQTYLNFSRRRGEAAAIMLSRGLWREMNREGLNARNLVGRHVRVHGVLSGRDGLLLDAASRASVEFLP